MIAKFPTISLVLSASLRRCEQFRCASWNISLVPFSSMILACYCKSFNLNPLQSLERRLKQSRGFYFFLVHHSDRLLFFGIYFFYPIFFVRISRYRLSKQYIGYWFGRFQLLCRVILRWNRRLSAKPCGIADNFYSQSEMVFALCVNEDTWTEQILSSNDICNLFWGWIYEGYCR